MAIFRATIIYLLAAALLTAVLQENALQSMLLLISLASSFIKTIGRFSVYVIPVALIALWWFGGRFSLERVRAAFLVACAAVLLQVGFLLFKSALPQLVPFYADDFFARADQLLFFGYDGWQLAHALTPGFLLGWFPLLYLTLWSTLAYAFPIFVTLSDPDEGRAQRYIWLFFLSWIACGNIVALAGSSVGPIFYDQLYGAARFADLHAALEQSGFAEGPIGRLQVRLWENSDTVLSFISAFPSVHVAVASVVALYLAERLPMLSLPGWGFFGLTLLISVYSGYHYALDGLASLAIVLALNAALRRYRAACSETQPAMAEPEGVAQQ